MARLSGVSGENQRPDHLRMTGGDIEHDRASARVAEQVNRPEVEFSRELGEIIGVLEYRKVLAAPVPSFGEVVTKADRDDAMVLGKDSDLVVPVSIVVHRTMDQDERCFASALLIRHGISVHLDRRDAFRQRPNALHCHRQRHRLEPTHKV
jgi:hypothetical protein